MFDYNNVIEFWFAEEVVRKHFVKDTSFDDEIRNRFLAYHHAAIQGELYQWRDTVLGRLAEIIVIDQFSRNIFRDMPRSFQFDPMAVVLTQEAIRCETDKQLDVEKRRFMYMPLMHSESKLIHQQAIIYFNQEGLENNYHFEILHKKIIDRFSRYPHRNEILGRVSTQQEIEFLKEENSSF